MQEVRAELLSRQERRRLALTSLARSLLVTTAIALGYFLVPLEPHAAAGILALCGGLLAVSVVLVLEIRQILHSPYPGLQAISALASTTTLFLAVFAMTYYLMSSNDPGSFSEPLTKMDSAYFTVTAFATVGFGDIVAKTEVARAVTTVQMLAGLVLVGVIARVIVGAVQEGRSRQRTHRVEQ